MNCTERLAWAPSLGVEFTLRLDGFAFLFTLLVTGIGALVVIYAGAYLKERSAADQAPSSPTTCSSSSSSGKRRASSRSC